LWITSIITNLANVEQGHELGAWTACGATRRWGHIETSPNGEQEVVVITVSLDGRRSALERGEKGIGVVARILQRIGIAPAGIQRAGKGRRLDQKVVHPITTSLNAIAQRSGDLGDELADTVHGVRRRARGYGVGGEGIAWVGHAGAQLWVAVAQIEITRVILSEAWQVVGHGGKTAVAAREMAGNDLGLESVIEEGIGAEKIGRSADRRVHQGSGSGETVPVNDGALVQVGGSRASDATGAPRIRIGGDHGSRNSARTCDPGKRCARVGIKISSANPRIRAQGCDADIFKRTLSRCASRRIRNGHFFFFYYVPRKFFFFIISQNIHKIIPWEWKN
jgi:hypothetical protein